MNFKKYAICLVSSILLLCSAQSKACGFYESEADYRAMMFNVSLPSFRPFYAFNYTMSSNFYRYGSSDALFSDPNQNDRYRNCNEWLLACKNKPTLEDIYQIQYNTEASEFLTASEANKLNDVYQKNTFVKYLTQKENTSLLDYMVLAKTMELYQVGITDRFENWDNRYYGRDYDIGETSEVNQQLLGDIEKNLDSKLSPFLKQRYAFQACRLYYYQGQREKCIETYDKYFTKIDRNNLMSVWAGLFKAMSTPTDNTDRNKLLIQVFNNCDEKKFKCVQLLSADLDENTLAPQELSTAVVMQALTNPGRQLDQIKKAYDLDKTNPNISFLVLREINKLEDWMITPLFYEKYSITNSDPFRNAIKWWNEDSATNETDSDNANTDPDAQYQKENLLTDMQYMDNLKAFLISVLPSAQGDTKDFYAVSIAHISLLQEKPQDAKKYMAMVSDNANPSIQLQEKIETIWLAINTEDIHSDKFKKLYLENIKDLERISMPSFDNNKMLFTLTLSLANKYLEKGDNVYGNLMRMKSDKFKKFEDYDSRYYLHDMYSKIDYFDGNSTVKDIDELVGLLGDQKKTPFEAYLCDDYVSYVNAYKELRGTIAFRNNDLKSAYDTFSSIPQDYWQSDNFHFRSYLNEDPFVPKGLNPEKSRKFDYKFNKADFVKELIHLQEQASVKGAKSADFYNKLGDAYFNTTHWGNSWMMMRYSWSVDDESYSKTSKLPIWMQNYMTAGTAKSFYEKALKEAVNDEQRAYSTLMLSYINRLNTGFEAGKASRQQAKMYLDKLQGDYAYTDTYKHYSYNCSMIR